MQSLVVVAERCDYDDVDDIRSDFCCDLGSENAFLLLFVFLLVGGKHTNASEREKLVGCVTCIKYHAK
jgi:hypothetical protein